MAEKKFTTAVLITGDSTGAQKAIKLTQEQLDSLTKKTDESSKSWKAWAESAAGAGATVAKWAAGAVVAGATASAALVKSAIDSAEATGILAEKLGITTEALSKLQYAAKLSDVSQQALEAGMKRLSRTLTDAAAGTGGAAKAFTALHLSASEVINLPADEQLGKIADALNAVENQSQRAALAQKIFGKSGVELLPILAEGAAGIQKLGDEAERFGVVISGDMSARANAFNDNLDRMRYMAQGLGLSLAETLLPKMEEMEKQVLSLSQNKDAMEGISTFVGGLAGLAIKSAEGIGLLTAAITDLFSTSRYERIEALNDQIQQLEESLASGKGLLGTDPKALDLQRQAIRETLKNLEAQRHALLEVSDAADKNGLEEIKVTATKKQLAITAKDVAVALGEQKKATTELTQTEKDRREDEMAAIFAKAEEDKGLYIKKTTAAIKEQKAEADPWAEAMAGAVERIDAQFADAWKNIGNGFDGLLDGMLGALSQWLAEAAHLLITRPLVAQLSAAVGIPGMGGSGGGSYLSAGSALAKIPGIGPVLTGGLSPFLNQWGVNSGVLRQSFGAGGMGPPQTSFSLSGLGLNLGAGIAGNYLGNALYGGRDNSGVGATVGGLAGSYFGPVGTFVGSLAGNLLDSALGGSDFSGKRVKLGLQTGSLAGNQENARTLASGLRVGNITRRAGDAGLSDEQINAYLNAFDTLDAGLTAIARGAGVNVDFRNTTLAGPRAPYDGGLTPEGFFGSMAKGELRGSLQDAPAEFVKAWLAQVDDQLSQRTKSLLGDTGKKTAEQLVEIFGFAADLDRLLSIDVLTQAKDAAKAAGRTIMDAYDEATASVVDLAQQYDGTTGSMTALTDALGNQKTIALALAQQYEALAVSTSALIADTRSQIVESTMTPAQLYENRQLGLYFTTGALENTTDPAGIAALVAQGNQQIKDLWQYATPEQRKLLQPNILATLDRFDALAQGRIGVGQSSLASREAGVTKAVDLDVVGKNMSAAADVNSSAANVQAAAATDMSAAVADFGRWVANLPASIQVKVAGMTEVNV